MVEIINKKKWNLERYRIVGIEKVIAKPANSNTFSYWRRMSQVARVKTHQLPQGNKTHKLHKETTTWTFHLHLIKLCTWKQNRFFTLRDRSFHAAAPKLWNDLPGFIRNTHSLNKFKKAIKTFLFAKAF